MHASTLWGLSVTLTLAVLRSIEDFAVQRVTALDDERKNYDL